MITKTLYVPLFNTKLIMILYKEREKVEQFVGKEYEYTLEDISDFDACAFTIGNTLHMAFKVEEITVGKIAHESKHLVNELFRSVHIKLDLDNDEHECYLLQWFVDEMYLFWKDNQKRL